MSGEEKGFVIKDRRTFDEKGQTKAEGPAEKRQETPKQERESVSEIKRPVLPEVNFSTFVFGLSSTAFYHLGEIPDPQTGQKRQDIALAKHTIDTLGMLKEKTKGNLTSEEEKLLDSILTELRLRYVKVAR